MTRNGPLGRKASLTTPMGRLRYLATIASATPRSGLARLYSSSRHKPHSDMPAGRSAERSACLLVPGPDGYLSRDIAESVFAHTSQAESSMPLTMSNYLLTCHMVEKKGSKAPSPTGSWNCP